MYNLYPIAALRKSKTFTSLIFEIHDKLINDTEQKKTFINQPTSQFLTFFPGGFINNVGGDEGFFIRGRLLSLQCRLNSAALA